jgi:HAD superfamily hydrolase (TIGR01549 family)
MLTPNYPRKTELTIVPIEAVIFDLDGTLAHFNLDYKALRSEVRSSLTRSGVPSSVLTNNESIFEMLKKAEIFFKNNDKSAASFEEIRTQALAVAEKYEMEAALTTSLQTGAVETLKELKQMGVKMGLCTTSSEKAANYILKRFKIDGFFEIVVSRNKVKYVKPHTEQFELALKTLEVNPKDTVIVGDSTVDMESAKELKAVAVGLPTGFSTTEQLMSNGANYIVTSLTDLPILIKKMKEEIKQP